MPRLIWLCWAHMLFCWFCHKVAHMVMEDVDFSSQTFTQWARHSTRSFLFLFCCFVSLLLRTNMDHEQNWSRVNFLKEAHYVQQVYGVKHSLVWFEKLKCLVQWMLQTTLRSSLLWVWTCADLSVCIQLTLVISNSLISNNRSSRSEYLVPA